MFRLVAVPEGESWACLQCGMNVGHDTDAALLLLEGEKGQRGVTKTGICAHHAEISDIEDLRVAQRRFHEQENNLATQEERKDQS